MKRIHLALGIILAGHLAQGAQQGALTLDDVFKNGQQWLEQNIDPSVLHAFGQVDQQQVQQLFRDIEKRFHGDYVVDIASLRRTATIVLPLLELHSETKPYAAWLRTRMDYLEVAEQFRLTIPAPKPVPGQPPKPPPNPSPELQRKVWNKQIEKRPWPKAAETYVPRLKPVFAAQKIPAELVWIAEIESSFQPNAQSPVGAAGMFQFMGPTATSYGLSLRPEDERKNPEKSAKAAAKYLRYLYSQFRDWPLAVAAYNAGENRVKRLLKRHNARTFDQVAIHLPAETQMYVPKMEATLMKREGLRLASLQAPRS